MEDADSSPDCATGVSIFEFFVLSAGSRVSLEFEEGRKEPNSRKTVGGGNSGTHRKEITPLDEEGKDVDLQGNGKAQPTSINDDDADTENVDEDEILPEGFLELRKL